MDDIISRQGAIEGKTNLLVRCDDDKLRFKDFVPVEYLQNLPSAEPEIIRCKDCKHNPKDEWFGCPMSHLSEAQRPETAWCWKAERRTDESD